MRSNSSSDPYSKKLPNIIDLTPSEASVWELYKQGKKRAEIAAALNMKPTSVSRRLTTAKEKILAQ